MLLESLEDRRLLATLTVNTPLDVVDDNDALTSLREAVIAANVSAEGDIIEFDASLDGIPILLSIEGRLEDAAATGDLDITDGELNIVGNGLANTIIDGGGIDRVFDVIGTGAKLIEGVTVQGGLSRGTLTDDAAATGGGIRNQGDLSIVNSRITGNVAQGDQEGPSRGGGITNRGLGQLTVLRTTIDNNLAIGGDGTDVSLTPGSGYDELTPTAGGDSQGGGIHSSASLTITESTISGNSVIGGAGGAGEDAFFSPTFEGGDGADGGEAQGGGLWTGNNATATVVNSTLSGNISRGGDGGNGGAGYSYYDYRSFTYVYQPSGESGDGASGRGGGLFGGGGTVNLNSVTIAANRAEGGSGGDGGSAGQGGGVLKFAGTITSNNTLIGDNEAVFSPDFDGEFDSVRFTLLEDGGGAIGITDGDEGNLVGQDPVLAPLSDRGGPTLTHALLTGSPALHSGSSNQSTDQRGVPRPQGPADNIGAFEGIPLVVNTTLDIVDETDDLVSLREAIIAANDSPGVDNITFDPSLDGIPFVLTIPGRDENSAAAGDLDVTDEVTITGNGHSDTVIDGARIDRVFDLFSTRVTLENLTVRGGHVTADSNDPATAVGGGILSRASEVSLTNVRVTGNRAGGLTGEHAIGGGIANQGMMTITNSVIDFNMAGGVAGEAARAGGISNQGVLTVTGSSIGQNRAVAGLSYFSHAARGGGIDHTDFGSLTITSSTISGNAVIGGDGEDGRNSLSYDGYAGIKGGGGHGGGIYADNGSVTLSHSTLSGNLAAGGVGGDGGIGGISEGFYGYIIGRDGNGGDGGAGQGGGLFVNLAELTLNSTTIAANATRGGNGGVPRGAAADGVSGVTSGGGIFKNDGLLHSVGSLIGDNQASSGPDVNGIFDDATFTLLESLDGALITVGLSNNVVGQDPRIAPLANHGGLTQTHALLPGSPALNAGSSTQAFDQRGAPFVRNDGQGVDIGAFEANPLTLTVSNIDDSGPGSLRHAIERANSIPNSAGVDRIEFDIPGPVPHLIQPATPLPIISDAVSIDATTDPDYGGTPVVQIDGQDLLANGLLTTSSGSTISGLSVTRFTDSGIYFFQGGDHTASQNYLGITPGGEAAGNRFGLKAINSQNNVISENVASGNIDAGIFINGAAATGNTIEDNFAGTNPEGTDAVPNLRNGVTLFAPENVVSGNVLSGNHAAGVSTRFAHGGGNLITNNTVGLNAVGTNALPNALGVQLRSPGNTVADNTISGNVHGVVITAGDSNENRVRGNRIGTDPSGAVGIANSVYGVLIINSQANEIGGFGPGAVNVISGNGADGVILAGSAATSNLIVGNRIGVDVTGGSAIANEGDGVRIVQRATDNIVRSNQISGNQQRGVAIEGRTTARNTVFNNRIGTDAAGTSPLHNNNRVGLLLTAPDNVIQSNVISAVDIAIAAYSAFATENELIANEIGSTAALATPVGIHLLGGAVGTSVTANQIRGGNRGIIISGVAFGNDLSGNLISGQSQIAIDLGGDGVTPNDGVDTDEGPNRLQNTPTISVAQLLGDDLQITYVLNTTPAVATYPLRIEFFASDDDQASVLLGSDTYSSADQTAGSKTITLKVAANVLLADDQLNATATDNEGNTSELSLGFAIDGLSG